MIKKIQKEEPILLKVNDIENKAIRKSNSLIEARYRLTLGEQRILYLLASVINPSDEDFKKYRISIKDLAEVFSISYCGDLIEQVMDSLERLDRLVHPAFSQTRRLDYWDHSVQHF